MKGKMKKILLQRYLLTKENFHDFFCWYLSLIETTILLIFLMDEKFWISLNFPLKETGVKFLLESHNQNLLKPVKWLLVA